MARLFPNPPLGRISPEHSRMYRALRKIPGDSTLVWMSLSLGHAAWVPDWMVIQQQRVCYLISLSPLRLQTDLFISDNAPASVESTAVELNRKLADFVRQSVGDHPAVFGVIAFPHVPQNFLDDLQNRHPSISAALWGREMIRAETIEQSLLQTESAGDLSEAIINRLRVRICPEIGIDESLTAQPRRKARPSLAAKLTGHLLNVEQEFLAKQDLQLSPHLQKLAASGKTRIVTGVAGSGKSLVILYRMMMQERFNPGCRVLAISHNKPLCNELQVRLEKIHPETRISWQTFLSFCRRMDSQRLPLIKDWDKRDFLDQCRQRMPELSTLPVEFLLQEVDWIRDQGFDELAEYLTMVRHGRRRKLRPRQRAGLIELLGKYHAHLARTRQTDWPHIAETGLARPAMRAH